MSARQLLTRLLRRRSTPGAPPLQLDELSERLRMMRGNITTPMRAGTGAVGAQRHDRVRTMARAARDNLFVDRSVDDDVLRNVTEYRSIDDRRR